ncbi:MAG: glycosyltransferase family 2 protein [Steroidobacteraceae bacterium]
MKTCIVIPFYNHAGAIEHVLGALKPLGLHCLIVDDGSDAEAQELLSKIAMRENWVKIVRLSRNGGKGAAVMAGCDSALAEGFTHAMQIDADGQHDAADAVRLLELAAQHPEAVIAGVAVYDSTVPRSRRYGRYLTHALVWLQTLSLEIRDTMCGFRVYPLAVTCEVWRRQRVGRRMDFDIEIIVRLYWSGVRIIAFPTHVTYPRDGVSHFNLLKDNILITALHVRLLFGMLWRLPALLFRRLRQRAPGAVA